MPPDSAPVQLTLRWVSLALVVLTLGSRLPAQSLRVDVPLPELQARAMQDSLDPSAHYNLALGYMSRKKYDLAEQSLQTALAIDPRFALAQLALAVCRDKQLDVLDILRGDSAARAAYREIQLLYQRAFLIDPFVDVRLMALVTSVSRGGQYASALKAFLEGRYPEAYQKFGLELDERLDGAPRDSAGVGLLWLHALSAVQSKEYAAAEADFQALIRIANRRASTDSINSSPLNVNEFRYMLAALKQQAGAPDEALPLYQEVLEADVSNYMAHVQMARIHEDAKDGPAAVKERRRAVEVNPDDASLLTDLGVTLGRSGDFAGAVVALREAVAANPRDVRPLFWLGIAELQLNDREAARSAFWRFVALAPSRQQSQVAVAREKLAALQ